MSDSRKSPRRGASPAIVVAALALVAALAGTAIAGPDAQTSALSKKKVKKIANKQINAAAPNLSVDNAENLGGDPASSYLQDNGVRYVSINSNGTINAAQSKGITQANVTKDGTGDYCINGLNPAPKGVSATLNWASGTVNQVFARLPADIAGHCTGQQVNVSVYNQTTVAQVDAPTYVVLF